MDFDTKADIVAECWMVARQEEAWKQLFEYGDLGFPLAYGHMNDLVQLEAPGKDMVTEVYNMMVAALDIPDEEYADFEAVLDKHIELHPSADEDNPV